MLLVRLAGAADLHASCLGALATFTRACLNELALKLCESAEHGKHGPIVSGTLRMGRYPLIGAIISSISAMGLTAIAAAQSPLTNSPAFAQGLTDQQAWETWFNGLSGQYRAGAEFWAGERSQPHPLECLGIGGRSLGDWTEGCVAAQRLLARSDARRKNEPDYWFGWNNFRGVAGASIPAENRPPPAAVSIAPPAQPAPPTEQASKSPESDPAPSPTATQSGLPDDELRFIAIIQQFAKAYDAAPNGMARGALRSQRAAAICALHLGSVTGWYGRVSTLSSNNEGKGVLAIQIADNVAVRTAPSSFFDA